MKLKAIEYEIRANVLQALAELRRLAGSTKDVTKETEALNRSEASAITRGRQLAQDGGIAGGGSWRDTLRGARRSIGEDSAVGSLAAVLRGGAVAMITNRVANTSEEAADMLAQFRRGKIGARELADSIVKTVPVMADSYRATNAIREIWTHEREMMERHKEEIVKQLKFQEAAQGLRMYAGGIIEGERVAGLAPWQIELEKVQKKKQELDAKIAAAEKAAGTALGGNPDLAGTKLDRDARKALEVRELFIKDRMAADRAAVELEHKARLAEIEGRTKEAIAMLAGAGKVRAMFAERWKDDKVNADDVAAAAREAEIRRAAILKAGRELAAEEERATKERVAELKRQQAEAGKAALEETRRKAQEYVEQQQEGQKMTDQYDPALARANRVAQLKKLLGNGAISPEVYLKAVSDAGGSAGALGGSAGMALVSAQSSLLMTGVAENYRSANDPQKEIAQTNKESLAELKQLRPIMQKFVDIFGPLIMRLESAMQ